MTHRHRGPPGPRAACRGLPGPGSCPRFIPFPPHARRGSGTAGGPSPALHGLLPLPASRSDPAAGPYRRPQAGLRGWIRAAGGSGPSPRAAHHLSRPRRGARRGLPALPTPARPVLSRRRVPGGARPNPGAPQPGLAPATPPPRAPRRPLAPVLPTHPAPLRVYWPICLSIKRPPRLFSSPLSKWAGGRRGSSRDWLEGWATPAFDWASQPSVTRFKKIKNKKRGEQGAGRGARGGASLSKSA